MSLTNTVKKFCMFKNTVSCNNKPLNNTPTFQALVVLGIVVNIVTTEPAQKERHHLTCRGNYRQVCRSSPQGQIQAPWFGCLVHKG